MKDRFLADEQDVEPTAFKIMAGVIMPVTGIIGAAVYKRVGGGVSGQLSFNVTVSPNSLAVNRSA